MGLKEYTAKRDLRRTPEPSAKLRKNKRDEGVLLFVVQRHKASRLHYDFRLELDGMLKSWAVPKGPSMDPSDKRLAMQVEDHPFDYKDFTGVIPEGNYGAGIVEIWDKGTYTPLAMAKGATAETLLRAGLKAGSLKIILKGKKLKGEFALVRMKDERSWLLIKHRDRYAVEGYDSEDHTPKTSAITRALLSRRTPKPKVLGKSAKATNAKRSTARLKVAGDKVGGALKPMLATLHVEPFDDPDWLFEIKWDGYRAIAETSEGVPKLYSRNGLAFNDRFPSVANALRGIKRHLVLDGEIVAMDEHGKPSFQGLQRDSDLPLIYYVFDLLKVGDEAIHDKPLHERKALLRKFLKDGPVIRYCDHVVGKGKAFFAATQKQDLEGAIAKHKDSTYAFGYRSKQWLKWKNHRTMEVVIGGYTAPRNSRQHFGSLLLGVFDEKRLRYIGHAGTGFNAGTLAELKNTMRPLIRAKSPFAGPVSPNAEPVWVKPQLVAQVKFAEITRDGQLRHPVFQGLRTDKAASTVRSLDAIPKSTTMGLGTEDKERMVKVRGGTLKLTNLNKLFWPKEKITKGAVIAYYERMGPVILPYLKDRPQSLYRTPDGITKPGFFHKDAGGAAPDWVKSVRLASDARDDGKIDYILCNNTPTLLYLANLGCIELNAWSSRVPNVDIPDHLVMDLDPGDKNTFDDVVEAALAVKVVLDRLGLKSWCKTSGASGLHIHVPTARRHMYEDLAPFTKDIMLLVNSMLPKTTTLERSLAKRGKRQIYLDHLQNRQGQTVACVYSIRPRAGATVSTPITWDEVEFGLDPKAFTIHTVPDRAASIGDLFEGSRSAQPFALDRLHKVLKGLLQE